MTHTAPIRRPRSMARVAAAAAAAAAGIFALMLVRSELPQMRRYLRIRQM